MRKRLIVANWKMNMRRGEAMALAEDMVELLPDLLGRVNVVLAAPYISLDVVGRVIQETPMELGAQNVFWEAWGAFTGEISPYMLTDLGCRWVIIGHSERRNLLNETDEMVQKKIKISLEAGLIPIVCVGENIMEKEQGDTIEVIERQIGNALEGIGLIDSDELVIAYEPVWAIGTGNNATPEEIEHVHGVIREILSRILGEIAGEVRILYGGSVNPDNIGEILAAHNTDGALVGGASLRADSFAKIVQIAGE
jgi:triosephosphate isomerase